MVLSDDNIKVFQTLYKEHFGKDISKEDAYEQGIKLLRLVSILHRPTTTEDFEVVQAQQVKLLREQK